MPHGTATWTTLERLCIASIPPRHLGTNKYFRSWQHGQPDVQQVEWRQEVHGRLLGTSSSPQIWPSSIGQKQDVNWHDCNNKKSSQGLLVYSVHKWGETVREDCGWQPQLFHFEGWFIFSICRGVFFFFFSNLRDDLFARSGGCALRDCVHWWCICLMVFAVGGWFNDVTWSATLQVQTALLTQLLL